MIRNIINNQIWNIYWIMTEPFASHKRRVCQIRSVSIIKINSSILNKACVIYKSAVEYLMIMITPIASIYSSTIFCRAVYKARVTKATRFYWNSTAVICTGTINEITICNVIVNHITLIIIIDGSTLILRRTVYKITFIYWCRIWKESPAI